MVGIEQEPSAPAIRIYRNSEAHFTQRRDIENLDIHYTDAWFQNLRAHGFNGFWLNVWMRDVVAFREPETAKQTETRENLKRLMDRAARHDVSLYFFLNEPHAFEQSDPVWQKFPGMGGEEEIWPSVPPRAMRMICTTTQEGKDYVYENSFRLHKALEGFAGSIHINAAESPTHCYCHIITNPGGKTFASNVEHEGIRCPRCAPRRPEEVVSEILNLFHAGARDAGSRAEVIAWNWDWIMYSPDPQPQIIQRLHPEIGIMASLECGGTKNILGKDRHVEEYSLVYVGPSEEYRVFSDFCRDNGREMFAKLQLGTTHEAGSVANMPLVGNVFEKLRSLRDDKAAGYMACWNFGDRFTLNTAAVALSVRRPDVSDTREFLGELCRTYIGSEDGERFCRAVDCMQRAFDHFPLANRMLHVGPVPFALAQAIDATPLTGAPLTGNWRDLERGDDWDQCRGPYSWEEIVGGFEQLVALYDQGMREFEQVLFPSNPPFDTALASYSGEPIVVRHSDRLSDEEKIARMTSLLPTSLFKELPELGGIHGYRRLEEWTNGWTLFCCCVSTLHIFRNYLAKKNTVADYPHVLLDLQRAELVNVERALPLFRLDHRLGLHLEPQCYLVTAERLEQKAEALKSALRAALQA